MKRFLLEFLAIFLGVSLGFFVEEWREQNDIAENMEFVKRAVLEDLRKDSVEIIKVLAWSQNSMDCLYHVLHDELDVSFYLENTDCIFAVTYYDGMRFNQTGYKLMSSGLRFNEIEDAQTLADIEDFYATVTTDVYEIDKDIEGSIELNLKYFQEEQEWFLDIIDSVSTEAQIDYYLNDPDYKARVVRHLIHLEYNYIPTLKETQERMNVLIGKLSEEVGSEL